jgi:hypothetical protein
MASQGRGSIDAWKGQKITVAKVRNMTSSRRKQGKPWANKKNKALRSRSRMQAKGTEKKDP